MNVPAINFDFNAADEAVMMETISSMERMVSMMDTALRRRQPAEFRDVSAEAWDAVRTIKMELEHSFQIIRPRVAGSPVLEAMCNRLEGSIRRLNALVNLRSLAFIAAQHNPRPN